MINFTTKPFCQKYYISMTIGTESSITGLSFIATLDFCPALLYWPLCDETCSASVIIIPAASSSSTTLINSFYEVLV